MTYSSRFFLYAPVGVFLILCLAAGVNWWVAASALSDRLDAANGREIMPGVTLSFAAKKISGFPFNLNTELSGFAVTLASADGPTRWRSEKFAMHALTYGRDETIFEAAGKQRLEWGHAQALDFAVGALHASAIRHHGAFDRFDLDVVGFGSTAFTAQRMQFHARRSGNTILLFDEADALFSQRTCIRSAHDRYAATATAVDELAPLLAGRVSFDAGLKAWRAKGGVLTPAGPSPLAGVRAEELPGITALAHAFCR